MSGEPEVVIPAHPRVDLPGLLSIAAGTPYETNVRDVRIFGPWSVESAMPLTKKAHLIVYHHTASELPAGNSWGAVRAWLEWGRRTWPYGVPYNFLVMPRHGFKIYYLHDIDRCWPHTYGYNCATAIAACGDYSANDPPVGMIERMMRLADALATMWGEVVPEWQHRDVFATECPGNRLSPLLPSHGHQRD